MKPNGKFRLESFLKRFFNARFRLLSLVLIRVFLPIGVLCVSIYGLNRYHFHLELYSATFADYARTLPDRDWVELKETQLDLTDSVFTAGAGYTSGSIFGTVYEVYIPMRAPDAPKDAKVQAMLVTRDKATIDLVKEMKAISNKEAWAQFVEKNRERLFSQRTVRGSVPFWSALPDANTRQKIVTSHGNLNWEFAVFEEDTKPPLLLWVLMFVGAFPITWFCWFCPSIWAPRNSGAIRAPLSK